MLPLRTRNRLLSALVSGNRFAGLLAQRGDDLQEISGDGYLRQTVKLSVSADAVARSTEDVEFGPALGAWASATHIGVFEQKSGGDFLFAINIATPNGLRAGDRWKFPAGTIEVNY